MNLQVLRRILYFGAFLASGLCTNVCLAQGAPLFKYSSSEQAESLSENAKKSLAEIRPRTDSSNSIYLIEPDPNALLNTILRFTLPDGSVLVLTKSPKSLTGPNYWNGTTELGLEVTFTSDGKSLVGAVRHEGRIYSITPLPNGAHVLEVRRLGLRNKISHSLQKGPKLSAAALSRPATRLTNSVTTQASSVPNVDILVVHYFTFVQRVTAQGMINQLNQSFANSGISATANLVGFEQVPLAPTINLDADLVALRYSQQVANLRNSVNADLVILLTRISQPSTTSYDCGVAGTTLDEFNSFAIVEESCIEEVFAFNHEVGHMAGILHQNDNPSSGDNHGYIFFQPKANPLPLERNGYCWATIVTQVFGDDCYRPGRTFDATTTINYWSTPSKIFGAVNSPKVPMGEAGTSNEARVIAQNWPIIAHYRMSPTDPPAPGNIPTINFKLRTAVEVIKNNDFIEP